MATPQQKLMLLLSEEDYLAFERQADERHEYIDGQIRAMAGESLAHARISTNLVHELGNELKGKTCEPLFKDMKVRSGAAQAAKNKWPPKGFFSYPDALVVCDPLCHDEHQDVVINPKVIIEVLSESTEAFDRGEKFKRYRKHNDTLTDYILIAQDKVCVEHFTRQADGTWVLRQLDDPAASLLIASIDCRLSLAELYDRVAFPEPETDPTDESEQN